MSEDLKPQQRSIYGRQRRVAELVDRRVDSLLSQLKADSGSARATLATLRNAITDTPGSKPELWDITSVHMTDGEVVSDDPTWDEIAVHSALCLFARHQQSRSEPMHRAGFSFGQAAKRLVLARQEEETGGVRSRFNAAATSISVEELVRHLSSIVAQLRDENIPLDYGALAEDIFRFQVPGGANTVRLHWARQYAQQIKKTSEESNEK